MYGYRGFIDINIFNLRKSLLVLHSMVTVGSQMYGGSDGGESKGWGLGGGGGDRKRGMHRTHSLR
jgi:hypothetical protein